MGRGDGSIRYTLYASVVVHASVCSWAVLDELRHFRHYLPPLRQSYEWASAFAGVPDGAVFPIASLPPDFFRALEPEPEPEPEPPPVESPDQDSKLGAADGSGYATDGSPGKEFMTARQGNQDQAWLSRDGEGPHRRRPDEPSESRARPGNNGAGGRPGTGSLIASARGAAGSTGSSSPSPRPGRVAGRVMPSPPPLASRDSDADAPLGVSNPPAATVSMKLDLPEHVKRVWIIPVIPTAPAAPPTATAPPLPQHAIAEPIAVGPTSRPSTEDRGPDTKPALARADALTPSTLVDRTSRERPDLLEGPLQLGVHRDIATTRPSFLNSNGTDLTATGLPTTRPSVAHGAPTTRPLVPAALVAIDIAPGVMTDVTPPKSDPDDRPMKSRGVPDGQTASIAPRPNSTDASAASTAPENPSAPGAPSESPNNDSAPTSPSSTAVASASPSFSPIGGGIPGPPIEPGDPAPKSETESDPFARIGSVTFRPGRVDARFGRAHKLIAPRLTTKGWVDMAMITRPRMVMKLTLDETGKVTDVQVLHSNCTNEIEQPTILAMYKAWFEPSKDKSGTPVKDVLTFPVEWR